MQRSKLSRAEVERILQAQASRQDRLACADIVIENQGSLAELNDAVNQMHQQILQIKKEQLSSS
jgi:dephospho-CoA kinase